MDLTQNKKIIICYILFPIIIGGVFYYITSPDVIFVKIIDNILGVKFHILNISRNPFGAFIRYYLLDMLWAFALTNTVYFFLDNKSNLIKAFVISFIFSFVLEVMQIVPAINGTFDIFDILFELIAELIAIIIIKTQEEESNYEEKIKVVST